MTRGETIAEKRKSKGLTQEILSEKLGVSPQAVSRWETDQTCPDTSILVKLAGILGCTVEDILEGRDGSISAEKKFEDLELRVIIEPVSGDRTEVPIPMPMVERGMKLNLSVRKDQEENGDKALDFDLSKIHALVRKGLRGEILSFKASDGTQVTVLVE